ncbi:MAG: glycoside hydrolase family 3 protein, partial [Lachnospiraceae bacterium]|nr:glycoside hydrolase family 3 protein [Lachnospiraceae bacterium]
EVSSDTLSGDGIEIKAVVTNTGGREGTETVQVYIKAEREGTPNAQLKGIRKVSLQAGESREISIKLPLSAFGLYDEQAVNRVGKGRYLVSIGGTQPESRSEKLTGKKVAVLPVMAGEEIVLE